MTQYTEDMLQVATYWPPGQADGFGQRSFGDVVSALIFCRWQDDAVLFRDQQGKEVVSEAVVYCAVPVQLEGWLAKGDETSNTDPRGVSGAFEIRKIGTSPSLEGTDQLTKAFL